ncbi:Protein phosphatase 2C 1 [Serendipita sp. 401]|nr:Protein phosphatase 2C 1 [Serendipita sp. 401]KAG9043317.1 Protein phosphatase 2C 1 [Serendipita sp. 407]
MFPGLAYQHMHTRDKALHHHPKLAPELVNSNRPGIAPMPFESPNARSKTITVADGPNTGGALNQHPSYSVAFTIGVAEDKGTRRTMEDSHSFVVDFDDIRGQGYFGLFDGHAGKHAAEWCGQHFHDYLLQNLHSNPNSTVPSILNKTFHAVDGQLSQMAAEQKTHSGCTAVCAFLRIEDESGKQSFLPSSSTNLTEEPESTMGTSSSEETAGAGAETASKHSSMTSTTSNSNNNNGGGKTTSSGRTTPSSSSGDKSLVRNNSGSKLRNAVRSFTSKLSSRSDDAGVPPVVKGSQRAPYEPDWETTGGAGSGGSAGGKRLRRVLYAANAGDARAVLCRNGEALRLTYDHKGSDAQESKRIMDAGGFVMNNRVNGVLAVTRSLGDSAMKDFVVGAPYTTETELGPHDEFIIVACDGLWDVTEDQEAVDLVRDKQDAQQMAKSLLDHALAKFSSDNVTVMVVRFKHAARSTSSSSS